MIHLKRKMIDRELMFSLLEDQGGNLYLEIVLGGIMMGSVIFMLSHSETVAFQSEGKQALDHLVTRVLNEGAKCGSLFVVEPIAVVGES